MSPFQRLVIRALLILIRETYCSDMTLDERRADWQENTWPKIQQFEKDAAAALEEEPE